MGCYIYIILSQYVGLPNNNKHLVQWSQNRKYYMFIFYIWHDEYSLYAKCRTNKNRKNI